MVTVKKLHFLDVEVQVQDGKFITNLYCKPTDRHQYLHCNSCHPDHIKNSIIHSQVLCIKRICPLKSDFKNHLVNLKNWFLARGYPEKLVNEQFKRACKLFHPNPDKAQNNSCGVVPLVVTYHPALAYLGSKMKKHFKILKQD